MSRRVVVASALTALAALGLIAGAPAAAQEPSPTPPLPTWTPGIPDPKTPVPTQQAGPGTSRSGCLIELTVLVDAQHAAYGRELWTAVEWWDEEGILHTVEGWQGPPDELQDSVANKAWWVAESQLEQGPFRWAVYRGQGGMLLGASQSFHLTCSRYTGPIVVQLGESQPGVALLPAAGGRQVRTGLLALACLAVALGVGFTLWRRHQASP
jgi:hypothetical protein